MERKFIIMHKAIDLKLNKANKPDNRKKNIIFLDIDGVLQPYNNEFRFKHDLDATVEYLVQKYDDMIFKTMDKYDVCAAYYDWDDIAIGYLKEFLNKESAYIVVSSGWKEYNNEFQLKALFGLYELDDYILAICNKGDKARTIQEYLQEHQEEINQYVVIDDMDMEDKFPSHCLKTYDRFTEDDYTKLCDMFEKQTI